MFPRRQIQNLQGEEWFFSAGGLAGARGAEASCVLGGGSGLLQPTRGTSEEVVVLNSRLGFGSLNVKNNIGIISEGKVYFLAPGASYQTVL